VLEQQPVAATEVEHARVGPHPGARSPRGRAPGETQPLFAGHARTRSHGPAASRHERLSGKRRVDRPAAAPISRATFSKYAFTTDVVARIVEQERVVAVRRVDLGIRDVAAVVDERLDDLA